MSLYQYLVRLETVLRSRQDIEVELSNSHYADKNPKGLQIQGYPLLICPCKATLIED